MAIVLSYLLGNFCTSFILGKILRKTDIRNYGSGNAGATNALRVFGKKIGAIAFLLDFLKGIAAVMLGKYILGNDMGMYIGGIFVAIGHNWPVLLKFKGGKGIAASFGVLVAINPIIALIALLAFVLIVLKTRYVSLGSIISAITVPISGLILHRPFDLRFFLFTIILAIMAVFRHSSNIKRLLNGTESKIGQKAK
ncbi:glycerol-3-phosphate 1-O-acyltransferase PlsY [Abyssisolibacter fermentans]|uniref:glycerol-3-phosphate 1-O-acyltransferase PlsY n=1 Tax=Abyssisolibacter fermentans TaxID=1766203 RepID=UPI000B126BC4|nr:glycerol-3-phosphate 1-O-acyltransferase PlsY [Abyssisolibacter fermentans]